MALVLYDTNILIDNFAGIPEAVLELTVYDDAIISSITWIEVACKMDDAGKRNFNTFLAGAGIGIVHPPRGRIVITRNPTDFGGESPTVHVPYQMVNGVAVDIKAPPP